jgi:2'-5' RNA ligase
VGTTSLLATTTSDLRDHWETWRPEWTPERTCLYWYVTFRDDELLQALGSEMMQAARADWLDAVPPQWCHVTVADVGFTDELEASDAELVTGAVAEAFAGQERVQLTLGPAQAGRSAVVLSVGPLERLRSIRKEVRRATSAVLGERHTDVHRQVFWPHLSVGYANQAVERRSVARFLENLPPVRATLEVDALTLAAVTRRDHGYRWQVQSQVHLR